MPILKVPIVHKFGIISHSQRLDLQQRLLKQTYDGTNSLQKECGKNPHEVSEQFVQKYNSAKSPEKDKLRERAEKMLQRSKRRCGYSSYGIGEHVDLTLAWSELAILAQCKGKLQEDCFDILCVTLDQAPLSDENIPTLFFVAESSLYWLRTDSLKQANLRTSEVKLLKMGQLVFARLLFHHLSGHLRGLADFKSRLHTYLEGIGEQQTLYSSYPGVWLCLRFIGRVGEIIIGPYANRLNSEKENSENISESVPALAACVYRALCVWKCASKKKVGLKKSMIAMLMAAHEFSSKDWINGFLAISLLGQAGKVNVSVCKSLQDLARGVRVNLTGDGTVDKPINHFPSAVPKTRETELSPNNEFEALSRDIISDIDTVIKLGQKSRDQDVIKDQHDHHNFSSRLAEVGSSTIKPLTIDQPAGIEGWCWESTYQYAQMMSDICLNGLTSDIQKIALLGKWQDADVTTFRAGAANPCLESCGLVDLLEYRGPPLQGRDMATHLKKIDWTWRIRYGALSGLARLTHALQGNVQKDGMRSAAWSLITAVQDCPISEERVLEAIRVSAVEFTQNSNSQVSIWTRIAEGLSDIYITPDIQGPLDSTSTSPRPRQEPRNTPSPSSKPRKKFPQIKRPTIGQEILLHTAIVTSNPDFNTRTSLDLKKVVTDQWKKEVIHKQEIDHELEVKEMIEKRKEEDKRELEMLEKRKEKLKGRAAAHLAPYQISNH